jgi:hypothetical protein
MESDKAPKLLGELRQLVDRWELELGAKPVWWRRYPAVQTSDAREKPRTSAVSPRARAKVANKGGKAPQQPAHRRSQARAAAAPHAQRVAGQ